MTDNIFERAAKRKLRFGSVRGELTTEQLYDLPLITKTVGAPDLDTVARGVAFELKGITETSFVETKPDPRKKDLETKLEIVKHIIADKQAAAKRATERAEKAAEIRQIQEALAGKKGEELAKASAADLEKRLAALKAEGAEDDA